MMRLIDIPDHTARSSVQQLQATFPGWAIEDLYGELCSHQGHVNETLAHLQDTVHDFRISTIEDYDLRVGVKALSQWNHGFTLRSLFNALVTHYGNVEATISSLKWEHPNIWKWSELPYLPILRILC